MRYSDRPISHPDDSLFGRARFALTLARSIDGLQVARDGFVIAILGEWGAGKTSIVELIRYYLHYIEMERTSHLPLDWESTPVPKTIQELQKMAAVYSKVAARISDLEAMNKDVVRWEIDGRRKELSSWLGSELDAEIADRFWQLQQRAYRTPRTIIVPFTPWLVAGRAELASALLSDLGRALGERLGENVRRAFGALLRRLSEFAPVAGAGLNMATHGVGGAILGASGSWANTIARDMSTGPTLDESRERLRDVLARFDDRKVLVIIDDLDRLTPCEALEMVSLVKSLGDLPNVIYLLCYEESKLATLVGSALQGDGASYLQKLVQYPVHLPVIDSDELAQMLYGDLRELLGDLNKESEDRLGLAWLYVLRHYIHTPRNVRRFINAVAVSYPGLAQYVDPVDLLILECLRLHEPSIYNYVRRNLDTLAE